MCHSGVIDFDMLALSSSCFQPRLNFVWWRGISPLRMMGYDEDWEKFWNDLDRIVDKIGNGYGLCNLGDLSQLVGSRVKVDVTGAFGYGRRVVE